MLNSAVEVVDYGVGNLFSVSRAIEKCGGEAICTSDPQRILQAKRLILPGVGAFGSAMRELEKRGLIQPIQEAASRGVPLLGICLGMQLLLEQSEEFGLSEGLGIIAGRVVPIPSSTPSGAPLKSPHIGWGELIPSGQFSWKGTLLEGHGV